jgi:hypothetical protein
MMLPSARSVSSRRRLRRYVRSATPFGQDPARHGFVVSKTSQPRYRLRGIT